MIVRASEELQIRCIQVQGSQGRVMVVGRVNKRLNAEVATATLHPST